MGGKTTKRLVLMLLGVGILFGGLFGWGMLRSYFIAKFLAGFAHQVQTVATITAAKSPWQPQMQSVGSLKAVNGASLSAEAAGIVDTIDFHSGEDVKKGTLLLTLRPNNDPAVLAELQAALKLSEITYARDQKQFAARAISAEQLDTDRANLQSARAKVTAQEALMAEKHIRAPFSGRLGIREVDVGQYLPVGTAIVTLEQLDPLYVDFYVPQQALDSLQIGQAVHVTVDSYPGQTFTGQIAAIGSAVDTTTRSLEIRARLSNPDLKLRPGMFASVKVDTGAPVSYITLPQTAISYNSYGDIVYLVEHGTDDKGKPDLVAHSVFVKLGETRGDQVAVLSGIKPGDVVVTAGQMKLRPGVEVRINNSVTLPNSPNPNPPNE